MEQRAAAASILMNNLLSVPIHATYSSHYWLADVKVSLLPSIMLYPLPPYPSLLAASQHHGRAGVTFTRVFESCGGLNSLLFQ